MTVHEIRKIVQDFVKAARNAMEAELGGVELDGHNGLLHDQFVQDVTNQRDNEYGGNIDNRSRFTDETVKAVADPIVPVRVGYRMSPWSTFGMRMKDPIPQFTDVINKLKDIGISHIHLIESRICGGSSVDSAENLDFAYKAWKGTFFINGGYTPDTARKPIERHPDKNIIITFGRSFIVNPDLVYRAKHVLTLNCFDRFMSYSYHSLNLIFFDLWILDWDQHCKS
jgi:NADPH2 dehydrogenase